MNLAAPRAWRLTGSAPVLTLRNGPLGVRQWVAAISYTPAVVRGLSQQGMLLPEPDLAVLIDPLHATGLDVVPPAVDRVVPEASFRAQARPRMISATPLNGPRGQGAEPGRNDVRPAAAESGAQSEDSCSALADARRAGGQPARLATILQRHAGSVAQLHTETHSRAGRGAVSIGQVVEAAAPQRPAADRKVVYLPARASPPIAMPDALRAAAEPARWEANMAATFSRWTQAGAAAPDVRGAVIGEPGRRLQDGMTGMPAPRLPISIQNAGRAAVMPDNKTIMHRNKPTGFAGLPASATGAARLAQALHAAMPPMAGGAENPLAAAQPVIESLARIAAQLTSIEMKFAQAAQVPAAVSGEETAPAVQWLEDDDLAGRLQGILRRQARRRGIDLS